MPIYTRSASGRRLAVRPVVNTYYVGGRGRSPCTQYCVWDPDPGSSAYPGPLAEDGLPEDLTHTHLLGEKAFHELLAGQRTLSPFTATRIADTETADTRK